jgi:hypothetical protein
MLHTHNITVMMGREVLCSSLHELFCVAGLRNGGHSLLLLSMLGVGGVLVVGCHVTAITWRVCVLFVCALFIPAALCACSGAMPSRPPSACRTLCMAWPVLGPCTACRCCQHSCMQDTVHDMCMQLFWVLVATSMIAVSACYAIGMRHRDCNMPPVHRQAFLCVKGWCGRQCRVSFSPHVPLAAGLTRLLRALHLWCGVVQHTAQSCCCIAACAMLWPMDAMVKAVQCTCSLSGDRVWLD